MGIFDFFKKDKVVSKRLPQVLTPPPCPQLCEVRDKVSIADYFNFDILNICSEDYPERVTLAKSELGMFPYVDVHYKNGQVNYIEFISHSKKFTPEIAELISRCAITFGATKSGETSLTQRDNMLLERGLFSRMWTPIWFDCGPDYENGGITAIRLTIFNPSKNGTINLK